MKTRKNQDEFDDAELHPMDSQSDDDERQDEMEDDDIIEEEDARQLYKRNRPDITKKTRNYEAKRRR
jgi:hypothetical protein